MANASSLIMMGGCTRARRLHSAILLSAVVSLLVAYRTAVNGHVFVGPPQRIVSALSPAEVEESTSTTFTADGWKLDASVKKQSDGEAVNTTFPSPTPDTTTFPVTSEPPAVLNDSAADIWWLHYPALLMVIVSFIISPILTVLMYIRRNTYPFDKLETKVLVFNELIMPWAVWQGAIPIAGGGDNVPCWVSLLFWDIPLFPTTFIILYLVYKLWLTTQYNKDILEGKTDSFVVRYRILLSGYKVIAPAALVSWGFTWLGVLPRAVRVFDYWNYSLLSKECNNFQPQDEPVDITTSILFTLGTVIAALVLLRNVKDAFNMKDRFIKASIAICISFVFVDSIPISHHYFTAHSFTIIYGISIFVFSFGIHLFSWFISFSAVWASYRYEKEKTNAQILKVTSRMAQVAAVDEEASTRGGGAGKGISPIKSKDELRTALLQNGELVQVFMRYLVQELCVENLTFLKMSDEKFRALSTEDDRKNLSAKIVESFIRDGAIMEINISAKLKKDTIERYHETGGKERTFWDELNAEVYGLLMDPFNRFCKRRKRRSFSIEEEKAAMASSKR